MILLRFYADSLGDRTQFDKLVVTPYFKQIEYAMTAMCLHTTDDVNIYKQINIKKNPYAYLLFLVDNLQDWSRIFETSPEWPIYQLYGFQLKEESMQVHLKYLLKSDTWSPTVLENSNQSYTQKKELIDRICQNNVISNSLFGISLNVEYHRNYTTEPLTLRCNF